MRRHLLPRRAISDLAPPYGYLFGIILHQCEVAFWMSQRLSSDRPTLCPERWAFLVVPITNCPMCNLFTKNALMLYNEPYGR
jgi:hypothetical protein